MKRNLTLLSLYISCLLFSANTVNAQVFTPRYNVYTCFQSNGYYEYLPQGYSPTGTQTYPLLITVHGEGEIGDGSASDLSRVLDYGTAMQINQGIFPSSFLVNGQTFSFIVLSPQFNEWPFDQTLDTIIDYAIQHYKVDTNRIYLTGISMGGGVVWQYAGNNPTYANRIAAMVPIAGASWPDDGRANIIAAGDIAVWATHNLNDPTVPVAYTNGYIANINSSPTPPDPLANKTIFNSSSHDAWTATYDLGFVTENGLNIYQWMLQFSRGSVVLPITGLSLNVTKQNTGALLTWKTYSENYNKGFEIERSADGNSFDSIGFVSSHSLGGAGASYGFTDAAPLNGKNYYRLKQQDLDGSVNYSPIEFIDFTNTASITIYPNPASSFLNINTTHAFTNAQLIIRNTNGQTVKQSLLNGNNSIPVSISNLPPGIYSAEIKETDLDTKLMFIKQ